MADLKTLSLANRVVSDNSASTYGAYVLGTERPEEIIGSAFNDYLIAGGGDDLLEGGAGDDFYVVGDKRGDVEIDDAVGTNSVYLASNLALSDIHSRREEDTAGRENLVIDLGGDKSITIDDALRGAVSTVYLNSYSAIDLAQFVSVTGDASLATGISQTSDGTSTITRGTILNDTIQGSARDEVLSGLAGDDVLKGGAGSDVLLGGDGNDRYVFNVGDGNDTIVDSAGINRVVFGAGLALSDFSYARTTDGLGFVLTAGDDSLTIDGGLTGAISTFDFSDGSGGIVSLSISDVLQTFDHAAVATSGTDQNDVIVGGVESDHLSGGLSGDTLIGNDGDDVLDGGGQDDELIGGRGNDTLIGGDGSDKYVFNLGDGEDTVIDSVGSAANYVQFGSGISISDLHTSVRTDASGQSYLVVAYGNGDDAVSIANGLDGSIDRFEFLNSGSLTFAQLIDATFDGPLNRLGGIGDDLLYGGRNEDTLEGGAGNDRLFGQSGDDTILGGQGNDVLDGGAGDDILDGGAGNDEVDGGAGDDIYQFAPSMGVDTINDSQGKNVIELAAGIFVGDLKFSVESSNLRITNGMTGSGYLVNGYASDPGVWAVKTSTGESVAVSQLLLQQQVRDLQAPLQERVAVYASEFHALIQSSLPLLAGPSFHGPVEFSLQADGTYSRQNDSDTGYFFDRVGISDVYTVSDAEEIDGQSSVPTNSITTNVHDTRSVPYAATTTSTVFKLVKIPTPTPFELETNNNYSGPQNTLGGFISVNGQWYMMNGTQTVSNTVTGTRTETIYSFDDEMLYPVETIDAGASSNKVFYGGDRKLVDGGAGDDLIEASSIGPFYQQIDGTDGGFSVLPSLPGSFLYGNDGDDQITGTSDNDELIGGKGNDTIDGEGGADNYLVLSGSGQGWDEISDSGYTSASTYGYGGHITTIPLDTVVFDAGISPSSLQVSFSPADGFNNLSTLKLQWSSDSGISVVIPDADPNRLGLGIEWFQFADGTRVSMADMLARAASSTEISGEAQGLTRPLHALTFDEHVIAENASVNMQYADLGVTFSPSLYFSPTDEDGPYPNVEGSFLANYYDGSDGPDPRSFSIDFATTQHQAAFAMVSNGEQRTFEALLAGTVVDSFDANVGADAHDFYGFKNIDFDQIRVTGQVNDDDPDGEYLYADIDSLQWGSSVAQSSSAATRVGHNGWIARIQAGSPWDGVAGAMASSQRQDLALTAMPDLVNAGVLSAVAAPSFLSSDFNFSMSTALSWKDTDDALATFLLDSTDDLGPLGSVELSTLLATGSSNTGYVQSLVESTPLRVDEYPTREKVAAF